MTHAELRRLAEAATPGPWYVGNGKWICALDAYLAYCDGSRRNVSVSLDENTKNSAYIAAVNPQTVLGLLDEIERLRLREDLAAMRAGHGILGSIRGEIK